MTHLREAGKADLKGLFELDQICFPAGIAYSLREFRFLLNSPRFISIVAELGPTLAGFVVSQPTHDRDAVEGRIITIDVAPVFRRRGVGRLLMRQIEEQMKDAGSQALRLETAVTNDAALRFYESQGFRTIDRIRNYYPGNLDAFVMKKDLTTQIDSIR
jgi:ribosomal-protein-alanine N-acetyltransferase